VDWAKLREEFRPKALASQSTHEFAEVCAEMLKPLRDLHVWMTVAGVNVPVFNRPRSANSNPSAHRTILGELHEAGRVQWAVTSDKIGFIAIYGWNTGPEIPAQVDEALEQMRDTRGLIIDVRLNGGGDEPTAGKVAGRFLPNEFVYSYSQFRNGPSHTNLTEKYVRKIGPRGSWRYSRPVVLLIGQKCMSSNESFIAMMSGDPDITIMGDHTCGSSGNPRIVKLSLDMTVSVPRWIDYLPDGKPLDERGFQPQIQFEPKPGAFEGERDDLLTSALELLRKVPLPEKAIEGAAAVREERSESDGWVQSSDEVSAFRAAMKEEAQDTARPKVISVTPANDATGVPAVTELRVGFDRTMEPMSLKLDWESGGFLDCEYPKYDSARHEFVIPVHLAPGELHRIVLNKPLIWMPSAPGIILSETRRQFPREGFQSADHHQAGLFLWQFRTQSAEANPAGEPPKVISISPETGSTVALLTFAEIQFDQPMAPPSEAISCVVSVPAMKSPGAICSVEYNSTSHTFRIPLLAPLKDRIRFTLPGRNFEVPAMLTPREKVTFNLAGFRSAKGVAAAPVKLEYRVSETEFASADRKKIAAAAKDPRLLAVLDELKEKRQRLTSVAERVQNLELGIKDNLFNSLKSQSATFRWQQPGQFYADIGEIMLSCDAFRIGSDGQSWWFHAEWSNGKKLEACPVKEMHEVDSLFCDPFELGRKASGQAAKDRGLRYTGLGNHNGVECHALDAWNVSTFAGMSRWAELNQWWIDARTALPVEAVKFHEHGCFRTRYLYEAINTPLEASAFAMPKIEGLPASPPEALDSDYTNRYVVIRDGSDGRISARWGKQGPKGSSSGGLN